MNKEEAKQLRSMIQHNYSNWNYVDFCKALGLNEKYAEKYWLGFHKLSEGISIFDDGNLAKIFTPGEK